MSYLQKQNIKREIAKKLDIVDNIIPLNKDAKSNIKVTVMTLCNNMKRWAEYIWLDHDNNYRSKTRILNDDGSAGSFSISKLPTWNFDGSSTLNKPMVKIAKFILNLYYMVRDPFRLDNVIPG